MSRHGAKHHYLIRSSPQSDGIGTISPLLYGWRKWTTYHLRSHGRQVVELRCELRPTGSRTSTLNNIIYSSKMVYLGITHRWLWGSIELFIPASPNFRTNANKNIQSRDDSSLARHSSPHLAAALLELGEAHNSDSYLHILEPWLLFSNIMKCPLN